MIWRLVGGLRKSLVHSSPSFLIQDLWSSLILDSLARKPQWSSCLFFLSAGFPNMSVTTRQPISDTQDSISLLPTETSPNLHNLWKMFYRHVLLYIIVGLLYFQIFIMCLNQIQAILLSVSLPSPLIFFLFPISLASTFMYFFLCAWDTVSFIRAVYRIMGKSLFIASWAPCSLLCHWRKFLSPTNL